VDTAVADDGALAVADTGVAAGPEGCSDAPGGCCDAVVAVGTAGGTYVGAPAETDVAAVGAIPDSMSVSVVSNVTPSVDTSVMPKMAQPMQQRMVPA
jgi:hypothetical protein